MRLKPKIMQFPGRRDLPVLMGEVSGQGSLLRGRVL